MDNRSDQSNKKSLKGDEVWMLGFYADNFTWIKPHDLDDAINSVHKYFSPSGNTDPVVKKYTDANQNSTEEMYITVSKPNWNYGEFQGVEK